MQTIHTGREYFIDLITPRKTKQAPASGFKCKLTGLSKPAMATKLWRSRRSWGDNDRKAALDAAKQLRLELDLSIAVVLRWRTTTIHEDGMHVFNDRKET